MRVPARAAAHRAASTHGRSKPPKARSSPNNKGNPVKQYEPFFSATSDFEDEDAIVATGVTPIIHYHPLDRAIRTELPDGSESRVEFDPWHQVSFDPNDAVVGTRWLTEHQSGTPAEQRAATLALAHANTPTTAHLDTLGRPFLTQADNGPTIPGGPHRLLETRLELDIQGNTLAIIDARGNRTIEQKFDPLKRRIQVSSPDAGVRLAVADVAGKPLRTWDSRGQTHRSLYDALQRPTHSYVKLAATERLLVRTVFGEALDLDTSPSTNPSTPSPAQALNLRGKPYQLYDCAGLVTNVRADFKGNPLESSRRLASDYHAEPNWSAGQALAKPTDVFNAVSSLLDNSELFTTKRTYDALNRVTSQTSPDNSVHVPTYNEANLLEKVHVSVRGGPSQLVIQNIDYNARGQRILCEYANPLLSTDVAPVITSRITYTYDPFTFRLTRLLATRASDNAALQKLEYTYDPVGNIVQLDDRADTAPLFSGTVPISADGQYEYDAIYRLTRATGREHPGTQPIDLDPPSGTAIPHPNDLQALQQYVETYAYDDVGNIQQIAHTAGSSGTGGWTRSYDYFADSNRLRATSVPGSPLALTLTYGYENSAGNTAGAHGSMTSMPHLAAIEWDYADRMRRVDKGGGGQVFFTYDASGQRVRKVWEHGVVEERIYLGGFEIYRKRLTAGGAVDLERETFHVMDDQRRVAMVETKTREGGAALAPPVTRWRFQLDNHLGSATLELDQAGNVIGYEEYHPYGSTAFSARSASSEVSAKRYRYTGKERDEETGLYYHGARYYAPWLGRWTAADPAAIQAPGRVDSAAYTYVRSNPIKFVDDTGHEEKTPHAAPVPGPGFPPSGPAPKTLAPPPKKPPTPQPPVEPQPPPPNPVQQLLDYVRSDKFDASKFVSADKKGHGYSAEQIRNILEVYLTTYLELERRGLPGKNAALVVTQAGETGFGTTGPNVAIKNWFSVQPSYPTKNEKGKPENKVFIEREKAFAEAPYNAPVTPGNRSENGKSSPIVNNPTFESINSMVQAQLDLVCGTPKPGSTEGSKVAMFPPLGRALKNPKLTSEGFAKATQAAHYGPDYAKNFPAWYGGIRSFLDRALTHLPEAAGAPATEWAAQAARELPADR